MNISNRLRALREEKKLSQGDIKKRNGLFVSYISRLENDHMVPKIETLEKMAHALEVPLYTFFYDGEEPPPKQHKRKTVDKNAWGNSDKDSRTQARFCQLLGKMNERDRLLLFSVANYLVSRLKVGARV
jgi:transcriptional regulator with XRE-family HTH domain